MSKPISEETIIPSKSTEVEEVSTGLTPLVAPSPLLEEEESYEQTALEQGLQSVKNKFTSDGLAICRLCGYAGKDLTQHLKEDHEGVEAYKKENPGWPIYGQALGEAGRLVYKERKKKEYSVLETFGFYWSPERKKDKMVNGYVDPGPYTPDIDPFYQFPEEETQVVLLALHLKDKIMIYGPSGTGKTSLVEQVCARLNMNFIRINMDNDLSRSDLIGKHIVVGREMQYLYGILPRAMVLPGTITLIDEYDAMPEGMSFVIQRVMERPSQLQIMEKGEEMITLHRDNTIFCAANTMGQGDDTGLHSSGTNIINYSALDRLQMYIELDYPKPEREIAMLKARFPRDPERPRVGIKDWEAKSAVQMAGLIRKGFLDGNLTQPLSPRNLINFVEKYLVWGKVNRAAKFCFINRAPREERATLEELVVRCWPRKKKK